MHQQHFSPQWTSLWPLHRYVCCHIHGWHSDLLPISWGAQTAFATGFSDTSSNVSLPNCPSVNLIAQSLNFWDTLYQNMASE
jgi:hypothetical protein